jgi:2,4-dienoyl-CoA reductase-like NADH-dependent reductase (Old Yellow Enzyme family)
LVRITEEVRKVWPQEYPLFVRISATDWVEDGWKTEDSVELAKVLKQKGVDLIDCSTGGNVPNVKIPLTPGYQVQFAEQVRKGADILTGAVGLISSAEQAEQILTNEQADIIIMARELLRDPYFPLRAAKKLGVDLKWPVQYERAKPKH